MDAPLARGILRFMRRYAASPAPEAAFNALALAIFAFQYEKNALYGRFCRFEGAAPGRLRHWKEIPAMPAAAFKEMVLTSFPAREKRRVFKTSGTTTGSTGAHYFKTLALYEASIGAPFERHVLAGPKRAFHFLMPREREAPHSSLSYMMERVNRRFARGQGRFYVRDGEPDFAALAARLAGEKGPVLLLSTAFALKGFLDFLEKGKKRLALARGSRIMETGGFKGRTRDVSKRALYASCGHHLGVRDIVSEYGMTELSSQYYAGSGGVFRAPAWLRAVVVDPRTGRECAQGRKGLLKHVDLANLGSVLAVQTEDLGREVRGGFELLGRARGSQARGCSLSYERFVRIP